MAHGQQELGAFLRSRRERLHPQDVGLPSGILTLLQRLPQTAGFVMSAAFEVLAWNDLAATLMEDFAPLAPIQQLRAVEGGSWSWA